MENKVFFMVSNLLFMVKTSIIITFGMHVVTI